MELPRDIASEAVSACREPGCLVSAVVVHRNGTVVAGSRIGAVEVSGALGGEKGEVCARAALDTFAERVEFVESVVRGSLFRSPAYAGSSFQQDDGECPAFFLV